MRNLIISVVKRACELATCAIGLFDHKFAIAIPPCITQLRISPVYGMLIFSINIWQSATGCSGIRIRSKHSINLGLAGTAHASPPAIASSQNFGAGDTETLTVLYKVNGADRAIYF